MQAHIRSAASRTFVLVALVLTAACGGGQPSATPLDQPPRPRDVQTLNQSIDAHYPAHFRAEQRQGSVLLDIYVDEQGVVEGVDVVQQTASDSDTVVRMVLLDEHGRPVERAHQPKYDPAFGPAAKAALLDTRFTPAIRNGRPISDTVRMTVTFAPSGGA